MQTLSVVISAWNEEKNIGRALKSVSWADELIVVDNSSTDDTAMVAKKHGALVIKRLNNPMLNINKNYGFDQAKSRWILSLDADEEITDELAIRIKSILKGSYDAVNIKQINGYWIPRKNIIFKKWVAHGLWWPDKQLRLFKKGKGRFACKHVHEYLDVDGPTADLNEPYVHYNYTSISQYIRKMDTIYTESEVQKLTAGNYQLAWYDAIRFPLSDFIKIYFLQSGYKDGLHGLVLSVLQAFYSFIVFVKLWERNNFDERDIKLSSIKAELYKAGKDIRYWILTSEIKNAKSRINRALIQIKRRILS